MLIRTKQNTTLILFLFLKPKFVYDPYDEIVCDKQQSPVGTELFVAKKRALMAELPKPSLTPSQGLDLLYTSLHISIRDRIPRDSIATFEDFFFKGTSTRRVCRRTLNVEQYFCIVSRETT